MDRKTLLEYLVTPLLLISLTACNFPVASEPTATLEPTQTQAPASPMPVATATPLPTSPVPTSPPAPPTSAPPAPQATRLTFQPGATNVDVQGSVAQGGATSYLLKAGAKQTMMVMLSSANQALVLQIQAPDGTKLASASQSLTYFQGTLPLSGDYLISVVSNSGAGNFDLNITIPVRVSFVSGAVSATMNGLVGPQQINTYLLRASKDQTMTVTIKSPKNNIFLTIYGLEDGNPYVRSVMGLTTYTFKLPATQDYVIQCVSTSDTAENYTVTFTVI
jgi:hypothetical protein